MSRGPGKWQRLILQELESRTCFYLRELLPMQYRKSDYNAADRAMWRLEGEGKIWVWRYLCRYSSLGCHTVISRIGCELNHENRPPLKRIHPTKGPQRYCVILGWIEDDERTVKVG